MFGWRSARGQEDMSQTGVYPELEIGEIGSTFVNLLFISLLVFQQGNI